LAWVILHKKDKFNIFSTIVDDCFWNGGVSRDELETFIEKERGELDKWIESIERAIETGCSSSWRSLDDIALACVSRYSVNDFIAKYLDRDSTGWE